MDYRATAETLRRLLLIYEGVTVDRRRAHPSGSVTVTLRIAPPASLARLACWAANANVACYVWVESGGTTDEEWASPDRVRYELRVAADPEGAEPPSAAQRLGSHLVNDLAERGLLDRAEADRLLVDWGYE